MSRALCGISNTKVWEDHNTDNIDDDACADSCDAGKTPDNNNVCQDSADAQPSNLDVSECDACSLLHPASFRCAHTLHEGLTNGVCHAAAR